MLNMLPWCDIAQTITLKLNAAVFTIGDVVRPITCSSTSGEPCVLTTNQSSICDIVSNSLRANAIGPCIVYANQPGKPGYLPAPQVSSNVEIVEGCTVSVRYIGTGKGVVTSSGWPSWYKVGETKRMNAKPSTGSKFVGWTGVDDCSTAKVCTFKVTSNLIIYARFDLIGN
jgi:hypothetical protein